MARYRYFLCILMSQYLFHGKSSVTALHPLGCFSVSTHKSNHSLSITVPEGTHGAVSCVSACHSQNYRYAGIVASLKCHCGNTFSGQSSDACTVSCIPDSSNWCGGDGAISVYETGGEVPGAPLNVRLLESTSSGFHISWEPPPLDGSEPVLQFQVIVTPLESLSGLEPPVARTYDFDSEATSGWLSSVQPATHYTIEVRAANTAGQGEPSKAEGWTEISHPPIPLQPEMISRTPETITVKLHAVYPTSGPITAYQIVVVDETVGAIMNPSALTNYASASAQELPYYITAQFTAAEFDTVFTVGDSNTYGGYFNARLTQNRDYHILLGAVSKLNKTLASYSPSDHGQHTSSVLSDGDDNSDKHYHDFSGRPEGGRSNHVSDHLAKAATNDPLSTEKPSFLLVGLSISVGILGCLVLIAVVVYIALRIYLQAPRRPDNQELTVNSYDNRDLSGDGLNHYLPEEDLPDHYSRLKKRVAVMAPSALTIVGEVGQGSFGAIRKGILKSSAGVHSSNASEGPVLVHHILDSSLESGDKAAMLRWLGQHVAVGQHQHVVALMGLVEEVAAVSLVFQYHTSTLKQHLTDARAITHYPVYADKHRRFSTISEQQVLSILCGVSRGLQWLRCCGVAHGFVCARNVVLVDGAVPKLTGFGLLSYSNDLYVPDHRRWQARELLQHMAGQQNGSTRGRGEVSSLQGDVWSFGVLMWECVTLGGTPYPELRGEQLAPRVQTGLRPPQPQHVAGDLYQVMLDCWQLDPAERPQFPQLEATINQLSGEGSHLFFASYPGFQYQLYAPHLEFND